MIWHRMDEAQFRALLLTILVAGDMAAGHDELREPGQLNHFVDDILERAHLIEHEPNES